MSSALFFPRHVVTYFTSFHALQRMLNTQLSPSKREVQPELNG